MSRSSVRLPVLTTFLVLAASSCLALAAAPQAIQPATRPAAAPASQLAGKPKVIVVPIQGPLYYQLTLPEVNKIVRGATMQKAAAVIFVISSPDADRDVAFSIAEQIAGLPIPNVVAYVSGDYAGVFGPSVFPLLACTHLFIAPENTIDLRPATADSEDAAAPAKGPLTTHQVSLLQGWAADHRLPWRPVEAWLAASEWLPPPGKHASARSTAHMDSTPRTSETADAPAVLATTTQPAAAARSALRVLHAAPAEDLNDVLGQLGLAEAWVLTWPDPVAKSNEKMQRVFRAADDLVKQTNDAIAAARDVDPRAAKYELRDVFRHYTTSTVGPTTRRSHPRVIFEQTDTIVDHDLFGDGGAAWRANTDRCIAQVRKAIESNRNLVRLITQYPEVNMDLKELNESYATLTSWLNQLRAERNLRSPP